MPRSNNSMKLARDNSRERRAARDQTFSAAKKSLSKFGFYGTQQPVDEPTGVIRQAVAARNRHPAKITLAPMPWDGDK